MILASGNSQGWDTREAALLLHLLEPLLIKTPQVYIMQSFSKMLLFYFEKLAVQWLLWALTRAQAQVVGRWRCMNTQRWREGGRWARSRWWSMWNKLQPRHKLILKFWSVWIWENPVGGDFLNFDGPCAWSCLCPKHWPLLPCAWHCWQVIAYFLPVNQWWIRDLRIITLRPLGSEREAAAGAPTKFDIKQVAGQTLQKYWWHK